MDEPPYPPRLRRALGRQAPPVLCVKGDVTLLGRAPRIAIVGSREPSAGARQACRAFAGHLSRAGRVVVSGGARGIDALAHSAALHGGVVVVSPVGLDHFRWRGRRPGPGHTWCLLAQFAPAAGWRNEQALMRNRVIVALADAVVAFEPRDRGGTWHSCNQALALQRPLFVVNASSAQATGRGRERLVRRGAVALQAGHMPSVQELDRLIADYRPLPTGDQTSLFGTTPANS
jgi:DNA processing protein